MTGSSRWQLLLLRRLLLFTSVIPASMAADSLSRGASISNPQTLISSGDTFALGFFSPGNSTNSSYYLGIWYNRIPVRTVVWVANRVAPIPASATNISLTLTDGGDLAITSSGTSTLLWSAGINGKNLINPLTARLTEEGNLVVADGRGFVAWQSFDHPTDTLVPGMKLRGNRRTGLLTNLTSWRSTTDPAPGDYSLVMDVRGVPQLILYAGNVIRWRSGPWMGGYWSTFPEMAGAFSLTVFNFSYVDAGDEVTYEFLMRNKSMVSRLMINQTGGTSERSLWMISGGFWNRFGIAPRDQCDPMGVCGGYGLCSTNFVSDPCQCMRGFVPRNPGDWGWREGRAGCRRTTALDCGGNGTTDGFVRIEGLKLPDTMEAVEQLGWGAAECRSACLQNCSCTAYSAARGDGSGCLMWFGELMDVRTPIDAAPDLFVRLGAADLDKEQPKGDNKKVIYGTIVGVVGVAVLLVLCVYIVWRRKKRATKMYRSRDFEVPSFEFTTILAATSNFSITNKLGEGGFGPVYKGKLETGQDVAIKRLSTTSTQGIEEFRNEVAVIAKLQHRNLVKLLGFCLHGNERMLIYDFMPHRSLDHIIFDKTKSSMLNWESRYRIILGIARGILYLHEDSRLRIIHRDLKAGNILLDKDMNPKISDFGMARIFGGDETEANTKRVVGTYGYMSPEYALDGIFSVKSDVFSFGVLLLEILSGSKNRAIFQVDPSTSLLGQAWNLWRENRILELVDPCMHSFPASKVLNCIKIGLICVQEHPDDRPTMSSIVTMLTTTNTESLLEPNQPGYATLKDHGKKDDSSCSNDISSSTNEMSVTICDGR